MQLDKCENESHVHINFTKKEDGFFTAMPPHFTFKYINNTWESCDNITYGGEAVTNVRFNPELTIKCGKIDVHVLDNTNFADQDLRFEDSNGFTRIIPVEIAQIEKSCTQQGGKPKKYTKTPKSVKVGNATRNVYTNRGHEYVKWQGDFVTVKTAQKQADKGKKKK